MTDWSILNRDDVMLIAERSAKKVHKYYPDLEVEDLCQEAYVNLATRAHEYYPWLDKGAPGVVHYRVYCDLMNLAEGQTRKTCRNISLDEFLAQVEDE